MEKKKHNYWVNSGEITASVRISVLKLSRLKRSFAFEELFILLMEDRLAYPLLLQIPFLRPGGMG